MPRPLVAIIVKGGVVERVVSNMDLDYHILDYDDLADEELPETLKRTLESAAQWEPVDMGDPTAEIAKFQELGAAALKKLEDTYG